MKWYVLPVEAWRALTVNRLRTVLTMLGMVIGVGAVVLMLAIGQGTQHTVNQSIASMGSNLLVVMPGAATSGGMRFGGGTTPTLTIKDAEALATLPSLKAVAPIYTGSAQLGFGSNNWNTTVYGSTPDWLTVREWGVEQGQPFSHADVRGANKVALIGQTVAKNLFGNNDPIGKTIRVKNMPFLVVGVLDEKGQGLDGRDQDDMILIPLTTSQSKLFGNPFPGTVRFIMAQAKSADALEEAEVDMTQLIRTRHRIVDGVENDFNVRNLSAMAQMAAMAAGVLSMMLGAIASISLLVGGIGIMNIMLVSVTERTREIGIRMAIGARQRDILWQFLVEAIMICTLGGALGLAIGIGGAWLVGYFTGMITVVTGVSVALAFVFSAGTGIFFGFYPARKAALMKPVEALRYE
jgi:putative ABC transport system permease protein